MMGTVEGEKLIYNIPTITAKKTSVGSSTLYYITVTFPYAVENNVVVSIRYKLGSTSSSFTTAEVNIESGASSGKRLAIMIPYSLSITGISPSKDDTYIYWE